MLKVRTVPASTAKEVLNSQLCPLFIYYDQEY